MNNLPGLDGFTLYGHHDDLTMSQFFSAMGQPYVVQGALMPDGHAGYSLPIGAVVATQGAVVPAWVGYDIGCGVLALLTGWKFADLCNLTTREHIMNNIYSTVPVGFNHHTSPVKWVQSNFLQHLQSEWMKDFTRQQVPINYQLGTLGSGNHFIEVGYDELDRVWIIIHSGSRNFGHAVATHYMKLASGDGKAREGNFPLMEGTLEFSNYLSDIKYVLEFALENRTEIARRVYASMVAVLDDDSPADWANLINRNHNHVEFDQDFGVYIHRKGATHAEEDMPGVIPGNMRDGSVIVRGLGNPASLFSSSHGAGRTMSRKAAKEAGSIEMLEASMLGITCRVNAGIIDEGPHAYKDFQQVLDLQKDLIEVVHWVRPLINVKGGK